MARLRKRSLIKRFDLPAVRRSVSTSVVDADNPFSNNTEEIVFTRIVAEASTLQTLSSWEISALPEGNSNSSLFTIFTNTPLFSAIENTSQMADSVYLPDSYFILNGITSTSVGGWYTVIKSSIRNSDTINHCQCVLSKDFNLVDVNNIAQYPTVVNLDPLINTRDKLYGSDWQASWLAENS